MALLAFGSGPYDPPARWLRALRHGTVGLPPSALPAAGAFAGLISPGANCTWSVDRHDGSFNSNCGAPHCRRGLVPGLYLLAESISQDCAIAHSHRSRTNIGNNFEKYGLLIYD